MLSRVGLAAAVGLLAGGAFAIPAYADAAADIEVKIAGTTIAAGAPGKAGQLSLVNHGPNDAAGVTVTYTVTGLDTTKVTLVGLDHCDDESAGTIVCRLDPDVVKAGQDRDLALLLVPKADATGDAGEITVSVAADTADPVPVNNTATAAVAVGGEGADLRLYAPDVYQDETEWTEPIPPGGTGTVWAYVQNQGDTPVTGITVTVLLPEHVWFTETLAGCTYYAPQRRAVCSREDVVLVPAHQDDPEDEEDPPSSGWFFWRVKVAANAPGPTALTGGTITAAPMEAGLTAARAAAIAPGDFFTAEAPLGIEIDVDPTDNTDEYTVFVAAKTTPSPTPSKSPTPSPSASGSGGSGGSLPVTGGGSPGTVAAIGLATLLLGSGLVVAARRRRDLR
ncbi:LPXTG cell wall anchor domain-containing protein [Micromonospora sp. CPCC 205371]|nr:LPXTG cell wall anchor domain-containing protein [Micromonospora sp. CPCC 205371]